jgi:hypothetical protein
MELDDYDSNQRNPHWTTLILVKSGSHLTSGLFNEYISGLNCRKMVKLLKNCGFDWICQGADVLYFNVLFWHSLEGEEKITETSVMTVGITEAISTGRLTNVIGPVAAYFNLLSKLYFPSQIYCDLYTHC